MQMWSSAGPLQDMRRIWLAKLLPYSAAAEAAWSCAADSYSKFTDVLLDVGILFEKRGLNSNCGVLLLNAPPGDK
jgi:hypothetical protein